MTNTRIGPGCPPHGFAAVSPARRPTIPARNRRLRTNGINKLLEPRTSTKDTAMTHRRIFLIASLAVCGLFAGACGSPDSSGPPVASISSSASAPSSNGSATPASALAYSQCMRAHGISDFPDPEPNGDLRLSDGPGSDLAPDNPAFKAADTACKSLLPAQAPPTNLHAQTLKYAKCMRAHGISDFPDPEPTGELKIQATPGSDLDINNPRYKTADGACKQYLPGGGAGGTNSAGGGS
ncbi:hypothetical protein [Amycolatopsis alkalitolerans]|uniref:hypothetical protein n=1 Tax=Amycolatopsis alkalitolerans TaxID=2547244 RepID=UPI001359356D|nr:hypothetical protein [Amycolatopsis alkalitolerans]